MRSRFFIGTCLSTFVGASLLSTAFAASLETELSEMLVNHPELRAAQKTSISADKEIDVQSSANLPQVSVNSNYGYEYITNPAQRSSSDGKNDSSLMTRSAGLSVTQKLFDGFATESSIRSARIAKEEAQTQEEITKQSLIFRGIDAYIEVLKHQRRIQYALENEENIKTQMELEDERVRRGSGIGIDVLNAKSRLQTAIDRRVGFEGELRRASETFKQVFGHAPDLAAMIDPAPPLDLLPATLDDAVKISLTTNPNILNSDLAAERARENKRTVRSQYMPTLDLVGELNYENDQDGTIGTRRDYSVLVEANWDLFSGFSTQHSMKQAVFDYAASKETHKFTARRMIEGTGIAWHTMVTNQERLALKENDLILKEEIFLSTRRQRESGAEGIDVINVLDREREVSNARIEYAQLFYDTRKSIYSVLLAIGQLTPDTLLID